MEKAKIEGEGGGGSSSNFLLTLSLHHFISVVFPFIVLEFLGISVRATEYNDQKQTIIVVLM